MIFTFLPELLRPKDDGAQTAPRRASQPRVIERCQDRRWHNHSSIAEWRLRPMNLPQF